KNRGGLTISDMSKRKTRSGRGQAEESIALWLILRLQFGFQGFQVADNHAAAVDLDHSLRLQPGEIAGYKLAHCADLRCQFLVADRHDDFHAFGSAFAFLLGKT